VNALVTDTPGSEGEQASELVEIVGKDGTAVSQSTCRSGTRDADWTRRERRGHTDRVAAFVNYMHELCRVLGEAWIGGTSPSGRPADREADRRRQLSPDRARRSWRRQAVGGSRRANDPRVRWGWARSPRLVAAASRSTCSFGAWTGRRSSFMEEFTGAERL